MIQNHFLYKKYNNSAYGFHETMCNIDVRNWISIDAYFSKILKVTKLSNLASLSNENYKKNPISLTLSIMLLI